MMLKVLIVDDDVVVRTNLKTLMDWNRNGFDICGEASNGCDAVQKLEKEEYHIVITDMSMPIMDGVALVEHIAGKHPSIKVIALSGYDDFDYVRQSLKNGAVDYILKHKLSSEVLLGVLETARKSVLAELKNMDKLNQLQDQLYQGRSVLLQKFIGKLVKGQLMEEIEIRQHLQALEISMELKNLAVIIAEIDSFLLLKEQSREMVIQSFLNIAEEVVRDTEKAVVCHLEQGRFVILISFGKAYRYAFAHSSIVTVIDRIKSSIKRYLSVTVSFGISHICENIGDIGKYYSEAEKALKDKFYAGRDRILWSGNEKRMKEAFLSLDIKDENYITEHLKLGGQKEVMDYLDTVFDRLACANASYKSVQMICAELFSIANKIAKEFGIEDPFINAGTETPYEVLKKFDTLQDIKQWVFSAFEKLVSLIRSSGVSQNYSSYTKKTIEFIHKNYQRAISLADAAEYVGVSSQYLSTVFKEDSTMGFIDYLNRIRIERAKVLMLGNESKLKEIVGMVGFNNYNYFFKVFKEATGMTPAEFEKLNRK